MKNYDLCDVLFINDNNLGFLGGEQESQNIILRGLNNKYLFAVVQPGTYKGKIENVKIYSLTKSLRMKYLIKNPMAFIMYIFKVGKCISNIHPKIVHSQSQASFFIVSFLKRFHIIPQDILIFHTERGLYVKYSPFIQNVFHISFKYLDTLITTTEFNKKCWKSANKKKNIAIKYKVIANTAGEIYESIDKTKLKSNNYLTVGFAGRYCDWKDWPLAEKICYEINKQNTSVHFLMCISCHDIKSKTEALQMFKRLKNKLGNRFIGNINVQFEEMEEFYYDIDVFILTSKNNSESFGRTLVEAMSRMTAVLITNSGGAVEVVGNEKVICCSVKEFAEKINFWNNNPNQLKIEKIQNLERVKNKYSLAQNISRHDQIYGAVCHQ